MSLRCLLTKEVRVMVKDIVFVLLGYLSGSILFARISAGVFQKDNMIECSRDGNPGTANAFVNGGFPCGVLTLTGDLLKGFAPVFLYIHTADPALGYPPALPFVMTAPVIGHAFPVYYRFRGGKGIAATFGILLGLLPIWQPVAALAFFFIFFSVVLRISPHFHRTLAAYAGTLLLLLYMGGPGNVWMGFVMITIVVSIRMLASKEEKEAMRVEILWMH